MAREIERLTPKQVANAKPKRGRTAALLPDGANLYLQATVAKDKSINRSWLFRYELDGKRCEMGLGPLRTVGLAEAREKARGYRQQLLDGIDPLDAKLEAREAVKRERLAKLAEQARAITFRQCAEMYLAAHSPGWKNLKHAKQWRSTLETYAYPVLGDLAVADVDTAHVVKAIEPIWLRIPETASRLRARIESVLGFATVRTFRTGDNPARWKGYLATLLPARGEVAPVEHHAALPYSDVPAFMADLRGRDSMSARALEFTILTAVRTGETIGAHWGEIDLAAKVWAIPAARMKAKRDHRVPLSDRAIAILKAIGPHQRGHVFPGGRKGQPLSNMAMLELLRGIRPGATVHGFRSSFRDWAAETTSHPNHVIEMALAHAIGDKTEKAYRRGELFTKRARLMQHWADFCARPPADVIPLHGVKKAKASKGASALAR
jgi:integrase